MLKSLLHLLYLDLLAIQRHAFSWLTPLLFYVMVVTLFPLALGSDELILNQIAPSALWIAALLATVLSSTSLFQREADDGHLDALLLSGIPLPLLVSNKIVSHWITHALPLILVSPLLGLLLHFNAHMEYVLMVSLLLGTPVLTLLGAIGAALVIQLRGQGLLLPILIMPLYVPVLIFGTSAMQQASANLSYTGPLAMLGALLLTSLLFAPFLASAALRLGVND